MSIAYLKVKIKSLAAEQAIIRHEERKNLGSSRWLAENARPYCLEKCIARKTWAGLRDHRLNLRLEIRAAFLAYGYLRGTPYRCIEADPHYLKAPYSCIGPNWRRVAELVAKYGPREPGSKFEPKKEDVLKLLEAWRKAVHAKQEAA